PCPKVVSPGVGAWEVCRDNGQVSRLWRANDMDRSSIVPMPEHQAAVSAGIVWVILDNLACVDNLSDLCRTDHTLRSCHLLHGMGQKQDFNGCCLAYLLQVTDVGVHRGYSMVNDLLIQQWLWEGRTPGLSCCRKRERSGRWRQSGAA